MPRGVDLAAKREGLTGLGLGQSLTAVAACGESYVLKRSWIDVDRTRKMREQESAVTARCRGSATGGAFPRLAFPEREPVEERFPSKLRSRIVEMERAAGWHSPGSGGVSKAACALAVDFVDRATQENPQLSLPRVAPSALGGVALQWDFPEIVFSVRVTSEDSNNIHYQKGARGGFQGQESGTGSVDDVLGMLRAAHLKESSPTS